ncbi:hypothetical protein [Priestia megaterium]|uniref:Uncharacterized protein n=1 Tax=Priestia megaterium TaxID=1404 RepID=A0A6M6EA50_PRIMG|nr:hypothetical protein [Priestia megaterium]QJX80445.1 hypothetical protein FDZ14_30625 [Priestia megaterium]
MPNKTNENSVNEKKNLKTMNQPEDTLVMQKIITDLDVELFKHKEKVVQTYQLTREIDDFICEHYASIVATMLQRGTDETWFKKNLSVLEGINLNQLVEDYIANSTECIQKFIANFMKEHVTIVKEIFLTALAIEKLQEEWKDSESHQHILKVYRILNFVFKNKKSVTFVRQNGEKITVSKNLRISDKEISVGSAGEHIAVADIKGYKLPSGSYLIF